MEIKNLSKKIALLLSLLLLVSAFLLVVFPSIVTFAQGNLTQEQIDACATSPFDANCPSPSASTSSSLRVCTEPAQGIGDIICKFGSILNSLIPVLIALGVLYFVWGVVNYVIGDDEEAKKKGRDRIIYGIIGLAVIIGLWGLVNLVVRTFNLDQSISFVNPISQLVVTGQPSSSSSCDFSTQSNPKFQDLLKYVTCIITSSVVPLIFALALVVFTWGVVQYVINSDDETKKAKGRDFMIWGIIALAVMVSVWGLVNILRSTFGIGAENFIPQLQTR